MSGKSARELPLHLMLLPGLLLILIYSYVPLFGLSLAFVKFLPAARFSIILGWDWSISAM